MELVRQWEADGFTLFLWDTYACDSLGKVILAYELRDNGKVIFEGADFACSPLHATDSDATVGALLGFLSLQPGDTDDEYFNSYTADQIAWRDSGRAEELSLYAYELENGES